MPTLTAPSPSRAAEKHVSHGAGRLAERIARQVCRVLGNKYVA